MSFLVTLLAATVAADPDIYPTPEGPALEMQRLLADAVVEANKTDREDVDRLTALEDAVKRAVRLLPPQAPVVEKLVATLQRADDVPGAEKFSEMKKAVAAVLADLTFEPVAEAELPAGFPTFTPVGTIEVKRYPEYRMASGPGFSTLFRHITSNRIEMTAPVQMAYEQNGQGELQEASMAFLYGDTKTGRVGQQGNVAVVDNQPHDVVSLGMRGKQTPEIIADARSRLQAWVAASSEYQASGELRVMGYNSPFVPDRRKYFEVQIPVAKSADATEEGEQP